MKKLILFLGVFSFFSLHTFAYSPNSGDKQEITEIKLTFSGESNQNLRNYHHQFKQLQPYFPDDSKQGYMITHMKNYLYDLLDSKKKIAKITSTEHKNNFFDNYKLGINPNILFYQNCIGRYNTLDMLSFVYDLPTALTIAVRYRESSCGYYLPSNGDGPFQIVSKDYGTGTITEEIFIQSIKDYLEFAKNKINRYNERNKESGLSINMTYQNRNYTDLWRFAGLYNGLSGGTVYGEIGPANPKYFLEGYQQDSEYYNGKKLGVFPQFLKILERELQNNQ